MILLADSLMSLSLAMLALLLLRLPPAPENPFHRDHDYGVVVPRILYFSVGILSNQSELSFHVRPSLTIVMAAWGPTQ